MSPNEIYMLNEYSLYGSSSSSWCNDDRFGSDFHISDVGGDNLYYSATLTSGSKSETPCDLSRIPYGTFLMRVTGALNPYSNQVSYAFCGVRGIASTQVKFQVDCDGECNPLEYLTRSDVCEYENGAVTQTLETTVTLHGSINIEGISHSALTTDELEIIRTTLEDEFNEAKMASTDVRSTVEIESWSPVIIGDTSSTPVRMLESGSKENAAMHQVNFKLKLIAEHFNVDGSIDKEIQGLAADLTAYVHHSMKSGIFVSKLRGRALNLETSSLANIKEIKLHELQVVSVSRAIMDEVVSKTNIVMSLVILFSGVSGLLLLGYYTRQRRSEDSVLSMVVLPDSIDHSIIHSSIISKGGGRIQTDLSI
jgi:hypothetical protein